MTTDWPIVRLGELCELMTGGTPPSSDPSNYVDGQIPWLVSGDVHQGEITECGGRITDAGFARCNARWLPANSVIIALNGQGKTRGTVALLRMQATCNQSLVSMAPKDTKVLMPEYLFWNLRGRYDEIRRMTGDDGNERRGLNMPLIRSIRLPVPPVAEQQRIVAILHETLERIEAATTAAQENAARARNLVDVAMRSMLDHPSSDWEDTVIGAQVTLQRGVDITKAGQRSGAVPVVSSGGIRSYHDTALVKAPGVSMGRKGTLGKVFYLDQDFWPHDTSLYVRDFKGNDVRFVYYFFRVLDVSALDSGAANPALNRNVVHALPVRWPPLDIQRSFVALLDELAGHANTLARLQEEKLTALAELKRSVFTHAFSGELTREPLAA
ncbi:restriction endonuclease subunit S [Brevundimonas sp.]|uniref:restriction endonuclease subunit S n=1 Tax=Brevundimonas sp. TaxID=1871086 RepID=UPI002FCC682D